MIFEDVGLAFHGDVGSKIRSTIRRSNIKKIGFRTISMCAWNITNWAVWVYSEVLERLCIAVLDPKYRRTGIESVPKLRRFALENTVTAGCVIAGVVDHIFWRPIYNGSI